MHSDRNVWFWLVSLVCAIGSSTLAVGDACAASCEISSSTVKVTEVDVGASVVNSEDEVALKPLVISPIPSGGSRLAWMGDDGKVHITTLDANDQVQGTSFSLAANDFSDLYADNKGGVLLLTRDAQGGGTLNCGTPANLCGTAPNPPVPCYDMYMVRFDGSTETWATKLTSSSALLPPYSTGPTGPEVYMIWWYAHHGRIASDGTNFAGYFGSAISVSQDSCINIHQGDRMKVVGPSGALQSGGFDWGCSHSGYERILWDSSAGKYVTVCKTDNDNRIAFAPDITTIYPVDLSYSNLGNVVQAKGGGYWLTTSNIRPGQPANSEGLADVRLLHFSSGTADKDILLASDSSLNDRAPHLASYGTDRLLAAWETSSAAGDLVSDDGNRKLYVQALDAATGAAEGSPFQVDVAGNRYQDLRSFPDGSVAYAAPGSSSTKIKILRILPCGSTSSTENNSAISPTTATFNKNSSRQKNIVVTMTPNGNTLNSIKNGSTALVEGSDYQISGNTVIISKSYLAQQAKGTTKLTFDFSAGNDPVLKVTIKGTV